MLASVIRWVVPIFAVGLLAVLPGCIPNVANVLDDLSQGSGSASDPISPYNFAFTGGPGVVQALLINEATGAVTQNGSVYIGGSISSLRTDPSHRFLYVVNASGLWSFTIDPVTGRLGNPAGPFVGSGLTTVAAHPTGKFVYVADSTGGSISGMTVNPSNGSPVTSVPGSAYALAPATGPFILAMDPGGQFLYTINLGSSDICLFTIDGTTGALTQQPTFQPPVIGAFTNATINPQGTYLYVTTVVTGAPNLHVLKIAPGLGTLSPIVGSPFSISGSNPGQLAFSLDGTRAYTANQSSGNASNLSIDPVTGIPTEAAPPTATVVAGSPSAIQVDPGGHYVYMTHTGSTLSSVFSIDSSGVLQPLRNYNGWSGQFSLTVGRPPTPVSMVPKFYFTIDISTGNVLSFVIDPASGALTAASNIPTGGSVAYNLAVHPTGSFLFVANRNSDNISTMLVNPADGTLTLGPTSASISGLAPEALAVDPNGQVLYASAGGGAGVYSFGINSSTGALTNLAGPITSGNPAAVQARSITIDPTGQYVYVNNNGTAGTDANIEELVLNPASPGTATSTVNGGNTGNIAFQIAADPTGQFAYASYQATVTLGFDIPAGGVLVANAGSLSTNFHISEAFSPDGALFFTTDSTSIFAYSIDPLVSPGLLTLVGTQNFSALYGETPYCVVMDPSGRFLFVATESGSPSSIKTMQVNPDGSIATTPLASYPLPGATFFRCAVWGTLQ